MENVAAEFGVSREDQDRFALRSQERALKAQAAGLFAREIVEVPVASKRGQVAIVSVDEHPRATSLEALAKFAHALPCGRHRHPREIPRASTTVRARCFLPVRRRVERHGLKARARIIGTAVAGVPPRIMESGPWQPRASCCRGSTSSSRNSMSSSSTRRSHRRRSPVLRSLGIADDAAHVNAQGGAIALGHPLGASGARLVTTALNQLERGGGRRALCTMCIGVGPMGIAMAIERVP